MAGFVASKCASAAHQRVLVVVHLFVWMFHPGLIIGVARGWQLALVLLGLVPIIAGIVGVAIGYIGNVTSHEAGTLFIAVTVCWHNSRTFFRSFTLCVTCLCVQSNHSAAYKEAGGISSEALSGIRTVTALSGQEKEVSRYAELLVTACDLMWSLSGMLIRCRNA